MEEKQKGANFACLVFAYPKKEASNIGTSHDLKFALFKTDTRGRIPILEIVYFPPLWPVFGLLLRQALIIECANDNF